MRFSIIIPAYNAEKYIRKALKSIKDQSYKDYELIVVCDSCTDRTEEIAKKYGARTFNVNYHNDGLSRSKGLDEAKGDWVLFMDDDDWWLHEFVLAMISNKIDRQEPDVDIMAMSFIWKHMGYAHFLGNNGKLFCSVWNKCWKRSTIGDTRFPKIDAESDLYFHTEMMKKNPKIIGYDIPIYYYNYMRKGSQTEKINTRKKKEKESSQK